MAKEEKETKPRFGLANFERRRHPRFVVDLPIEYWKINNLKSFPSRVTNISEGGLLVYFSEDLEIGQNLRLKLFLDTRSALNCVEALVQVVWKDLYLGKNGDYRTGVKFIEISGENLDTLKRLLRNLMDL